MAFAHALLLTLGLLFLLLAIAPFPLCNIPFRLALISDPFFSPEIAKEQKNENRSDPLHLPE